MYPTGFNCIVNNLTSHQQVDCHGAQKKGAVQDLQYTNICICIWVTIDTNNYVIGSYLLPRQNQNKKVMMPCFGIMFN